MKIGVIVDGMAEFRSLAGLYNRLGSRHELLTPLKADIQPLAPIPQIVGAVKTRLPILTNKGAALIIVLLDRESRNVCSGQWANQLAGALNSRYGVSKHLLFDVVIKNACYENWLIADVDVFGRMSRFNMSNAARQSIVPNKADHVDGQAILKAAAYAQRTSYSKISDAIEIMRRADPLNIAANSRSFRRFLRVIEHPAYLEQSRNPAPETDSP